MCVLVVCEYWKIISHCGSLYTDDVIATFANAARHIKRGSTLLRDIWNLPLRTKHVLHLNGDGQPIGESGATFKRCVSTITRLYYMCPLVPIDWREVPI